MNSRSKSKKTNEETAAIIHQAINVLKIEADFIIKLVDRIYASFYEMI